MCEEFVPLLCTAALRLSPVRGTARPACCTCEEEDDEEEGDGPGGKAVSAPPG